MKILKKLLICLLFQSTTFAVNYACLLALTEIGDRHAPIHPTESKQADGLPIWIHSYRDHIWALDSRRPEDRKLFDEAVQATPFRERPEVAQIHVHAEDGLALVGLSPENLIPLTGRQLIDQIKKAGGSFDQTEVIILDACGAAACDRAQRSLAKSVANATGLPVFASRYELIPSHRVLDASSNDKGSVPTSSLPPNVLARNHITSNYAQYLGMHLNTNPAFRADPWEMVFPDEEQARTGLKWGRAEYDVVLGGLTAGTPTTASTTPFSLHEDNSHLDDGFNDF